MVEGQYIGDDAINYRLVAAERLSEAVQAYRDHYGPLGLAECLSGHLRLAIQDTQALALDEVIARRERANV